MHRGTSEVSWPWIHTADWHIGSGRSRLPDGRYLDRQMTCVREIFETARGRQAGVVVSGDIFDNQNVYENERAELAAELEQAENDGLFVLIINGNHDLTGDHQSNLRTFRILTARYKNVHVVECSPHVITHNGVTFVAFPPWDRHALDAKTASKDVAKYLKKIDAREVVLVTHLAAKGSKTETGFKLPGGVEVKGSRVSYYALGDIHQRQRVARNAYYPGNPLHHRWGEKDADKGVLLVEGNGLRKPPKHISMVEAAAFKVIDRIPEVPPFNTLCKLKCPASEMPVRVPSYVIEQEIVPEEVVVAAEEAAAAAVSHSDPLVDIAQRLKLTTMSEEDRKWAMDFARRSLSTRK